MDLKSLYLLNTHVVTCRAVGLWGFRNSLLVLKPLIRLNMIFSLFHTAFRKTSIINTLYFKSAKVRMIVKVLRYISLTHQWFCWFLLTGYLFIDVHNLTKLPEVVNQFLVSYELCEGQENKSKFNWFIIKNNWCTFVQFYWGLIAQILANKGNTEQQIRVWKERIK